MLPKIAITMGDPAGVGPEIVVLAHAREELFSRCRPVVYGDPGILRRAARGEAPSKRTRCTCATG